MATNVKKPLLAIPQVFVIVLCTLLIVSCNDHGDNGNQVCISLPKDTSSLGRTDHFIPVMMIDSYKKNFIATRDTLIRRDPKLFFSESEAFNKAQILEILRLDSCVGLKIYYGIKPNSKNEFRLMIVGIDAQGKDLYLKKGSKAGAQITEENGGLEYGQCSPPCSGGR